MFVVNSRLGFSSAAGSSSIREGLHQLRPSFSRSYGCILPSSLTRVFPRTLGFSPRLPVSVCGTGTFNLTRSFSWQRGPVKFNISSYIFPSLLRPTRCGFAYISPYQLRQAFPSARLTFLLRHSIAQTIIGGTGIFTCCPSPTLFASA